MLRLPIHCPVFLAFLLFDWARWLTLAYINYRWPRTGDYAHFWALTEPLAIVLLAAMGIEAWGALTHPLPAWMYAVLILPILAVGASLPSVSRVPLGRYFVMRALVTFSLATVLLITMVWLERAAWHAVVVLAFCTIDVIG